MDHVARMFPFNLFYTKGWYMNSIVSSQSNASNGAVANGAEEGSKTSLGRTRSHVPDEAEMRKVFKQFDVNNDGVICSNELSDFVERLGFKMSREEVQALVQTVDQNSDGKVDFNEFYDLYSSLTGGDSKHSGDESSQEMEHEENLRQAFRVFDQDGDGFITVKELQSVLLSLGMKEGRSIIKCQQMIKGVDSDGNGKVDFQEFKKLMSSGAF